MSTPTVNMFNNLYDTGIIELVDNVKWDYSQRARTKNLQSLCIDEIIEWANENMTDDDQ